jgi:hypothetical protein
MSSSMSMSNLPLKKVEPNVSNLPLKKVEPNVSNLPLKKVEPNVSMEVLAPPLSKVESKVDKVRLSKLDLEVLSKKYNFEVEEALRYLKEEKSEKSKKSKDLVPPLPKVAYPLPFNGEKKEGCCNGIVKNHGLYTQCTKKVKGEFCKGCEEKPYGTIDDRLKVDLYEYKDPKGNGPKRYTEVLKKLKISKENVEEEAKRLNITISPIHLEEVVSENVKRGRPKAEKKVKEPTGKKGRPKKEKKSVEVNAEEEEDLFATLISNANANQPLEKVEPNEDSKEEAKEESTDLAPPLSKVEKVEKKSKKVKEADPAKEAEKQKKADEKAAKDAAKEIEKQKKAEEKAAKEAEKQKKAEEKAAKEAEKLKKAEEKAAKALAPPLPKVDKKKSEEKASKGLAPPLEKVEEEADVVRKFEHDGKSYYKSKNSGVIYNMEQEVVGKWNEERKEIDFDEEEEEEEEYDD